MKGKIYSIWRIIIILCVGVGVGMAAYWDNWIAALAAIIVGILAMLFLRRNVKEIIADERNYTSAYKAARLTMVIGTIGMAIASLVLIAINRSNLGSFQAQLGFILAYITCGLLVINMAVYTYYNRKLSGKE